jgi:hypothetical protein
MLRHTSSEISVAGRRFKVVAALVLSAFSVGFLFLHDPANTTVYPPCLFHALSGLHCPGCGSLRALYQLSHGHIAAAFGLNALMVMSLPFLGYAFLCRASLHIRGRSLPGVSVRPYWYWLLLGTILAFWLLRNIPLYPFNMLAP